MNDQALRVLCGSESRLRLFKALFNAPVDGLHLRGLAAAARVDPSHVHKLLPPLLATGLCEQIAGARAAYRPNEAHPLYAQLAALFGEPAELEEIDLARAPVLRSLLWTGRERSRIPAREAFRQYEANWRRVNRTLQPTERRLVERLAKAYGGGLING